jgi:hypothetical protein
MIGITLLTMLISTSPQVERDMVAIQDRKFHISGLYCDDKVCETAARPIADWLEFDKAANAHILAKTVQLPDDWAFMLNCRVSRDRLRSCYLTDHNNRPTTGLQIALDLTHRIKLTRSRRRFPRAIVNVDYEVGGCPSWYCIPTPVPQAPPPPPAGNQ